MTEDSNESRFNRRFLAYFAVGLVLLAMTYVFMVTFLDVPEKNVRFADTVLGFLLGTVIATPLAFYYGSSKSSQAKDEVIAQAMPNSDPPEPKA
jgi:hypothetical protein